MRCGTCTSPILPFLSHAAVAILSVCGSEAAVERTFSAQGLVHSDLLNRLGDATVEAEMFIKFNKATVTRVDQRGQKQHRKRSPDADAFCEQMGDDDKGDEPPPSIAGVFSRPKPPQQPRPSEEKANAEEHAQSDSEAEEKSEAAPAQVIQVPRAPQRLTFRPSSSTTSQSTESPSIALDRLSPAAT